MKRSLGLALLAILGVRATAAAAEDDGGGWHSLRVSGGAEVLARVAGPDAPVDRWRVFYESARRRHGAWGEALLSRRLAPGGTTAADPSVDPTTVPLPLAPSVWQKLLGRKAKEDDLAAVILADRRAAMLYRGLAAWDEETLRVFARERDVLRTLFRRHAEVLAVFGSRFRVQDGAVALPGGAEATPLWEAMAGESARRPSRFLLALLGAEGERRIRLFDAIARLDPARQRFALGLSIGEPATRAERFHALERVLAGEPAWWRMEGGAFARPEVDVARVLREVRVTAEGRLARPAARAFWEAAFADGTGVVTGVEAGQSLATGPEADAAWLVERVASGEAARRRARLARLLLAQRVFGDAREVELPEVVAAIRGTGPCDALLLALERLGSRDPGLYLAAVRGAERIAGIADHAGAARAQATFQGAIALVERARFVRALDVGAAEGLLRRLFDTDLSGDETRAVRLARWLEATALPTLARSLYGGLEPGDADQIALRALAGAVVGAEARLPAFEWEGLWYRADLGAGELGRLERVRARQGGNSLQAVLGYCDAVRSLSDAHRPDPERLASLDAAATRLVPVRGPGGERTDPGAVLRKAAPRLRQGAEEARSAMADLAASCDALTGSVLTSLAYAPHLGDPEGPALSGEDVSGRHVFGTNPWAIPREAAGNGVVWHVEGSLLGLEVALARLRVHPLSVEDVPDVAPALDLTDRRALAPLVSLLNPRDLTDADRDEIAASVARGRERSLRLVGNPSATVDAAAEAGLEPWRAQALRWAVDHDPDALPRFFTPTELFRLGRPGPGDWDAWGTVDLLGGGLRPRMPAARSFDEWAGFLPESALAASLPDLALMTGAAMASRRLPASLVPDLMGILLDDLLVQARPVAPDDWLTVARWTDGIASDRVGDAVAALEGKGPLQPAPEPRGRP